LAPYFGSSLYVWATVLAITLGGLALGYFLGGVLSYRKKGPEVLYYVMIVASLLVILMPFISKFVLEFIGNRALIPSIIVSSLLFLLPPVFMMGMVSPLIIRNITTDAEQAGKVAGAVYAISTVGGIIATFLTGFYIIPTFGLTMPSIITGIVLGIIPLLLVLRKFMFGALVWVGIAGWAFWKNTRLDADVPGVKVQYMSEGLLGQLMIVDYPNYNKDGSVGEGINRMMFVNRITQTVYNDRVDSMKYFSYIDYILTELEDESPGKKVLLCGLGGGSLATELAQKGFQVDACELDARIVYTARTFFRLDSRVNVYVDDARHFIRTASEAYDIIVLDMFKGEENPAHCFSVEAFDDMENILVPGGMIIINGNGFINGDRGKGMRAVAKSFAAAGFDVDLVPTYIREDWSNLVFFGRAKRSPQPVVRIAKWEGDDKSFTELNLDEDVVMRDDRPVLDQLNLLAYVNWRKDAITYFNNELQRGRRFPVFK
ncbi:MAG: fused MFS/spermidine synthase, partial [Bacteroidota bacterium]